VKRGEALVDMIADLRTYSTVVDMDLLT
jgi:hypothetical protein